jgi:hypothetical protein
MKIDPLVSFLGTCTLYPLDLNHCLILTHRQYALDSGSCNPLEDRINARYGDQGIFSFEEVIYERDLSEEEVCQINYIFKRSANRYIAASEKRWLYPEEVLGNISWEKINELLLPPKDKIKLTQSIIMGRKDGSAEGYDPFGRKVSDKEIEDFKNSLRFVKLGKELSDILKKASTNDLYAQNIALLDSINEIWGINKGKTIEDIRREFSDEQISLFYNIVAELWPYITNFYDLFPQDTNLSRGLFLGDIRPQTISRDITNMINLFDEIFIISPFWNPNYIRKEYSPLYNPSQYLRETYKLIFSLLLIEPFIRQGIVKIIPDPCEFDYSLRMKLLRSAERRKKNLEISEQDLGDFKKDGEFEFMQLFRSFPKNYLKNQLKNLYKDMPDEKINELFDYIELEKKHDLTDLGKSIDETGPQLLACRSGLSLEGTLLFCKLTGAVPFTYIKFKFKELYSVANYGSGCKRWNPLIKLFDSSEFIFDRIGFSCFANFLRSEGLFEDLRNYLRKIHSYICEGKYDKNVRNSFCKKFPDIHKNYLDEWSRASKICAEIQNNFGDSNIKDMFPTEDLFKSAFQKGKINLVLGDLNMESVDYLLKVHFPGKKTHNNIPMAICIDYNI